jgi:hypothetical protein
VANSFSHSQTSVLGSANLEKGSSEFTQSKEGFQKGPPYKQLHVAINGELFDNLHQKKKSDLPPKHKTFCTNKHFCVLDVSQGGGSSLENKEEEEGEEGCSIQTLPLQHPLLWLQLLWE